MKRHEYRVVVRRRAGTDLVVAKLYVLESKGEGYILVADGAVSLGAIGVDAHQAIGRFVSFNPGVEVFREYAKMRPRVKSNDELMKFGKYIADISEDERYFGIHVDTGRNWEDVEAAA